MLKCLNLKEDTAQFIKDFQVNPDFIYLDGPDQFKIKGKINNFNLNHEDFMPMVSDLLKIEFLKPGTILVVDGRSANVQFLRSFLKEVVILLCERN